MAIDTFASNITLFLDIAAKAFIGGDWSLLRESYIAMIRATLLEGLLYVVTVGKGSEEKIVSMGCWFGNGTALFATYAFDTVVFGAWIPIYTDDLFQGSSTCPRVQCSF